MFNNECMRMHSVSERFMCAHVATVANGIAEPSIYKGIFRGFQSWSEVYSHYVMQTARMYNNIFTWKMWYLWKFLTCEHKYGSSDMLRGHVLCMNTRGHVTVIHISQHSGELFCKRSYFNSVFSTTTFDGVGTFNEGRRIDRKKHW